jgi:hypothetical protein
VAVEMVQQMERELNPLAMAPSQLMQSRSIILPKQGKQAIINSTLLINNNNNDNNNRKSLHLPTPGTQF